MQTIRSARQITRIVLMWFVMALGVAIASPLVKPQALELICTGAGLMKVLVKNADGSSTEVMVRTLDCPLCATLGAPPPVARLVAEPAQPLAYVLQSIPSARIAALTAAPPPARGPPSLAG